MRIPAAILEKEMVYRRIVLGLGVVILIGCAAQAVIKVNEGDFKLHWETGRRFLAREFIYTGGHDFPYPPFFGMVCAPAALLPLPVAKAVLFPVGIGVVFLLLWILQRLVQPAFSFDATHIWWATVVAVFLAIQFLIHDQAILGLNTALVALTWLGVYFWKEHRDLFGGISLGAAIAIKCTPAIFLGYFLWKRQWRMAACTIIAALLFSVAPMIWQGPASWSAHMKNWVSTAMQGISGSGFERNEDFRFKNMSLRPVLLLYLIKSPVETVDHRRDPPSLALSPSTAGLITNAALVAVGGIFAWWSRGRVGARDDPRLLWELAAVGVLMVLFSPITWGQHCVALLPACFLIAALFLARDRLPGWMIAIVTVYVLFCALMGRDLIGRNVWGFVAGYHIATFCILALFPVLLAGPRLQSTR